MDLYLSEKEHEVKLLQGIQPANGLKTLVGAKKLDSTALKWQRRKMPLKRRLINGLQCRQILTFSNIQCIRMVLKKIWLLGLN